uniref:HORMA domain-containing protein n=1 Tax=Kwoniella bestiolae CBS 10118 TaxID=1296100 RepID=A0A1B9G9I0_9TREE|nr:hypothetical protein I302_02511 [Kwoniella bestiolae CBS 10118]OCF27667.1 hypothetical protein I302_02511 [Kwoniella bestiolae CBS 10118]
MARGSPKQAFGKQKQIQNQDQAIVTKEESFEILKVTLEANIGLICYLRNLFSDEDFDMFYIANSTPPPNKTPTELYQLSAAEAKKSYGIINGSQEEGAIPNVFAWRKIKENRTVVETYTFNFYYDEATGSPSMSIDHETNDEQGRQGRSLSDQHLTTKNQELGTPMTHLDVRRSVKMTTKSLINACQALVDLPRKRFVDIKLFYNEHAPENYTAPSFADTSDEPLHLGTRDVNQSPVWFSLEQFQTGHHGLTMSAVSIADFLPIIPEGNPKGPEDYARRFAQDDEQEQDAKERDIVWTAHDRILYDPKAVDVINACVDRSKAVPEDSTGALKQPIGRRTEDGSIVPIPRSHTGQWAPRDRAEKPRKGARYIAEETLQMSQAMTDFTPIRRGSSPLPQSGHDESILDTLFDPNSQSSPGNSTQTYLDRINENRSENGDSHNTDSSPKSQESFSQHTENDSQSASMSTQKLANALHKNVHLNNKRKSSDEDNDNEEPLPISRKPRAINTIISNAMKKNGYEPKTTIKSPVKPKPKAKPKSKPKAKATNSNSKPKTPRKSRSRKPSVQSALVDSQKKASRKPAAVKKEKKPVIQDDEDVVDCFCGSNDEDDSMIQCDGCLKWFHATCLGFIEAATASQLNVYCILCEMRQDKKRHWPKADIDKAGTEMAVLALVRRVMQELRRRGQLGKDEIPGIQRMFGCERKDVDQVMLKLKNDGLVEKVVDDSDEEPQAHHSWTWKWRKNPNAVKRFASFFQYGKGVENEAFPFRKWHMTYTPNGSQSQSHSQPQSANSTIDSPFPSQRSRVPDSQANGPGLEEDAEGEEDPEMSIDGPAAGPSSDRANSPYELPSVRSSRALVAIDCSDHWTKEA